MAIWLDVFMNSFLRKPEHGLDNLWISNFSLWRITLERVRSQTKKISNCTQLSNFFPPKPTKAAITRFFSQVFSHSNQEYGREDNSCKVWRPETDGRVAYNWILNGNWAKLKAHPIYISESPESLGMENSKSQDANSHPSSPHRWLEDHFLQNLNNLR